MNTSMRRNRTALLVAPGILGLLAATLFALVYWATVRTEPGRLFGDASLRGAISTHSGLAVAVDRVLDVISVAWLLGGIAIIALIALTRLRRSAGLVAVGIVAAANASTWVLKRYLLPRPDLGLTELTPATHNSLPSGHTTAMFSVVVALLFVVPARSRKGVAIVGGLGTVIIALATMSAGWHRAGDSVAAFFVVDLCAAIAAGAVVLAGHVGARPDLEGQLRGRPPRWQLMATGIAAAVGLGLAAALVLFAALRGSAVGPAAAFLAGALFIVVGAMLAVYAVLMVVDRLDL